MRKIFILIALSIATIDIYAQTSNPIEIINSVKINNRYVYGEATMESKEDATYLAFDFLFSNLKEWIAANSDNVVSDMMSDEEIKNCSETVVAARANMLRVFVYFDLNKIKVDVEPEVEEPASEPVIEVVSEPVIEVVSEPVIEVVNEPVIEVVNEPAVEKVSEPINEPKEDPTPKVVTEPTVVVENPVNNDKSTTTVDSSNQIEARPPTRQELFEQDIKVLSNVRELLDFFSQEKYFNRCKYGEVNADIIKRIDIKQAYLLLYIPESGEVTAILSHHFNGRIDLKTGYPDSTTNHKGCRAIWITYR